MDPISSAAIKVGVSATALVILAVRMKRSKRSFDWFGVTAPPLVPTLAFIAVYLAWMLGSDALTHWRGPWDFRPWQQAPLLASAMRVLAVCVLGPMVEELLFRGIIFSWLRDRVNVGLTIALTAMGWSLLHYEYSWGVIAIIFVDGLLLGLARWRTGSVFAPAAMHMLYNLYAIW
ncbi:MAG: CPBP family intramembrane glutamic endopeptidase [Sphingomicrobium sp.]